MNINRRTILKSAPAFALVASNSRSFAQAPVEITIAVSSTSFVIGGVRIGESAGLFEKNGLKPRIVVMDSGNAAMAALLGRSAQFAVAGPPEVLAARVRKQDIAIVVSLYRGLAGSLILSKTLVNGLKTKPDSPLTERLKALDGMSVAVPSATSSLLGPVRKAALSNGANIKFSYMAQPAMVPALEASAIQGMIASFPFAGAPLLKGTGVVWLNGPAGDLPTDALPSSSSTMQTTSEYAKANPDLVRRIQRSFGDIAHFIKEKPEDARLALAKGYSSLSKEELDLAFNQQKTNWTAPFLSEDDIQQEIMLLKASSDLQGLDALDPKSVIIPPL